MLEKILIKIYKYGLSSFPDIWGFKIRIFFYSSNLPQISSKQWFWHKVTPCVQLCIKLIFFSIGSKRCAVVWQIVETTYIKMKKRDITLFENSRTGDNICKSVAKKSYVNQKKEIMSAFLI